jgi:hypothetical protein
VEVPVLLKTYPAHPGRVYVYYHVTMGDGAFSDLQKAETVLRHMVGAMRA